MLFPLSIILAGVIWIGIVMQTIPVVRLIWKIKQPHRQALSDDQCPNVAIVLSLRGGDPFLSECLTRLVEQDYPNYEIFIALDNKDDPANEFVDELIRDRNPSNLTKVIVENHSRTCTLLNNNYIRVIEKLDPKFEIVVFVDADAVTWPSWLRSLIRPLIVDESVGGTSGNRWFAPQVANLGTLTRAAWNLGAVVQMDLLQFPWGGSMAIKADIAKDPNTIERWATSFAGDTPVYQSTIDKDKKFVLNPDVFLLNREDTSLASFYSWMPRQLLNSRLYHPAWKTVLAQAIVSSAILVAAMVINIVDLVLGNWFALAILVCPLLGFWFAFFGLFVWMNAVIESKAKLDGQETGWLTVGTAHKLFWVIPTVQFVYLAGIIKSLFIRNVRWRGIDYEIRSPFNIELMEYRPFQQDSTEPTHSL